MTRQRIRDAIRKNRKTLLNKGNVNLVACGYKVTSDKRTSELSVVVGVTEKIDKDQLPTRDIIPPIVDGVKTDVIETMQIVTQEIDPTKRHHPPMPGVSIGHKNVTAGTFGCVVKKDGLSYILSNNHVLAASNNAELGDDIYQPGPYDGGTSEDTIGSLAEFVPIVFDSGGGDHLDPPTCPIAKATAGVANVAAKTLGRKHRLQAVKPGEITNKVDAALADPFDAVDDEIIQIGKPAGFADADFGMILQKYGRTTRYTTGEVVLIDATVRVQYGAGKVATFTDQIVAGAMSQGGDSGSVVLDMDRNLVGLLFAGSDTTTIINPISEVFVALGLSL